MKIDPETGIPYRAECFANDPEQPETGQVQTMQPAPEAYEAEEVTVTEPKKNSFLPWLLLAGVVYAITK